MSTVWKVLLGLALVVPMGAYIAGSLVASAADDPRPRHPITLHDPGRTPSHTPSRSPAPSPSASEGPEVITPGYDDLGDDHGGDHGGDRHGGGDDHGGRGRG